MSNVRLRFRDRDIQRAIRACRSAGFEPAAIEVDPNTGLIRITNDKTAVAKPTGELDQWMKQNADEDQGH